MAKRGQHQEAEAPETGPAGNASPQPAGKQGQSTRGRTNPAVNRNATGPRTESGKRRASQNATKWGIFSRATLLKDESREEYESLRAGLWKSKQPGNEFEEILLDKMVSNLWRQRRALISEVAEIRKNSEFAEFDRQQKEVDEADGISQRMYPETNPRYVPQLVGLIWSIENPEVLERCLEILLDLQKGIEDYGFDDPNNEWRLSTIYGPTGMPHLRETLQYEYTLWCANAKSTEEVRAQGGCATPEESKQCVLQAIASEINRLEQYEENLNSIESKRMEVEMLRQRVPDTPATDRLLRYMTSLERAFERMLIQYDRAQRMRKG
ncbi:MAG: hypothetical protein WCA19_06505 [Candidatus Acidiferrales bacterium]